MIPDECNVPTFITDKRIDHCLGHGQEFRYASFHPVMAILNPVTGEKWGWP